MAGERTDGIEGRGAVELRFQHRDLSPDKAAAPERFKEMDEKGHVSRERVLRLQPPRLLVISWGKSEVTFELATEGENVRLILTHRELPTRAEMVQTSGGRHTHRQFWWSAPRPRAEALLDGLRRYRGRVREADPEVGYQSRASCGP